MDFLWHGVVEALSLVVGLDRQLYHAVYVSLVCTLASVSIAVLLAVPYGAWLGLFKPRLSALQVFTLRLFMAMPTVVIGLLVFGLLSRQGPLGDLDLLYTKRAIIAGEVLLALPLVGALTHGATASLEPELMETARTLGASRPRALLTAISEVRTNIVGIALAAFGRCLTELGVAVTVGGNLHLVTRTLPTSIQHQLGRGDFARALAPGVVLLVLAGVTAIATHALSQEDRQ